MTLIWQGPWSNKDQRYSFNKDQRYDFSDCDPEDVIIVDEDTGICYQGLCDEGIGDMLEEVEKFLSC